MQTGHVDIAERDRIAGWAADLAAPDAVLEVAIVVDGREIGRVKADRLRLDLQKLGQYGEGRHGFEFTFAAPLDPAAGHEVHVCIADTWAVLPRGAFRLPRLAGAASDSSAAERHAPGPPVSAPAPPRYVLHVGLPKTGTKYLQHNFWRLREELRGQGVLYPAEWLRGGPMFAHHDLAEALTTSPDRRLGDAFARLNACGSPTVLLSTEGFNGLPVVALEHLRDLTQGAGIEIVFYARRWTDWIPSQWQQEVKQGSLQTFPEWYANLLAAADGHPGINQASLLDKFAGVFGRRNIRLVSYSNLMDHHVDIFDHFCAEILGLSPSAAIRGSGSFIHESMGALLTELIRCLNEQEAAHGGTAGYHVYEAFRDVSTSDALAGDIAPLYAPMQRHIAETPLDDDLYCLRALYGALNDYRDQLVSPQFGGNVFAKRRGQCRSVRPGFLMEGDAVAAMRRIWQAVRQRLAEAAETAAAHS